MLKAESFDTAGGKGNRENGTCLGGPFLEQPGPSSLRHQGRLHPRDNTTALCFPRLCLRTKVPGVTHASRQRSELTGSSAADNDVYTQGLSSELSCAQTAPLQPQRDTRSATITGYPGSELSQPEMQVQTSPSNPPPEARTHTGAVTEPWACIPRT